MATTSKIFAIKPAEGQKGGFGGYARFLAPRPAGACKAYEVRSVYAHENRAHVARQAKKIGGTVVAI